MLRVIVRQTRCRGIREPMRHTLKNRNLLCPKKTSARLMAQVTQRPCDGAAWAEFVDIYGAQVLLWSRQQGLQEADARDVSQEILLRLWRHLANFTYDPSRSFRDYLRKVAQTVWYDWNHDFNPGGVGEGGSQSLKQLDQVPTGDELVSHIEQAYNQNLFERAAHEVRARVHKRTWQAFEMLAIENRRGIDTATTLGMQLNAVYAARKNVQKLIRETVARLEQAMAPP